MFYEYMHRDDMLAWHRPTTLPRGMCVELELSYLYMCAPFVSVLMLHLLPIMFHVLLSATVGKPGGFCQIPPTAQSMSSCSASACFCHFSEGGQQKPLLT